MFSALGLWGLAPVVQMWFVQNHVFAVKQALMLDLIMGSIYLVSIGGLLGGEDWFREIEGWWWGLAWNHSSMDSFHISQFLRQRIQATSQFSRGLASSVTFWLSVKSPSPETPNVLFDPLKREGICKMAIFFAQIEHWVECCLWDARVGFRRCRAG